MSLICITNTLRYIHFRSSAISDLRHEGVWIANIPQSCGKAVVVCIHVLKALVYVWSLEFAKTVLYKERMQAAPMLKGTKCLYDK